jgi:hypothetical protein
MSRHVGIQLTFFYPLSSCESISLLDSVGKSCSLRCKTQWWTLTQTQFKTLQKARPVAHLFALKACNWSGLYYVSYHMLTGLKNQDAQCPPQRHNFVVHNFHSTYLHAEVYLWLSFVIALSFKLLLHLLNSAARIQITRLVCPSFQLQSANHWWMTLGGGGGGLYSLILGQSQALAGLLCIFHCIWKDSGHL